MQQHRNIEVGGATLECTFYGSGTPVVLLANAGCSLKPLAAPLPSLSALAQYLADGISRGTIIPKRGPSR